MILDKMRPLLIAWDITGITDVNTFLASTDKSAWMVNGKVVAPTLSITGNTWSYIPGVAVPLIPFYFYENISTNKETAAFLGSSNDGLILDRISEQIAVRNNDKRTQKQASDSRDTTTLGMNSMNYSSIVGGYAMPLHLYSTHQVTVECRCKTDSTLLNIVKALFKARLLTQSTVQKTVFSFYWNQYILPFGTLDDYGEETITGTDLVSLKLVFSSLKSNALVEQLDVGNSVESKVNGGYNFEVKTKELASQGFTSSGASVGVSGVVQDPTAPGFSLTNTTSTTGLHL